LRGIDKRYERNFLNKITAGNRTVVSSTTSSNDGRSATCRVDMVTIFKQNSARAGGISDCVRRSIVRRLQSRSDVYSTMLALNFIDCSLAFELPRGSQADRHCESAMLPDRTQSVCLNALITFGPLAARQRYS
jgi:hypothetical protein